MYYNIKHIETVLEHMKCDFADLVWKNYVIDEYALKQPEYSKAKLKELRYFIDIIQSKLNLLKIFQTRCNYYGYPQRTNETDVDTFWNTDTILSSCDSNILEKFKHYGKSESVLSLYGNPLGGQCDPVPNNCGCP